LHVELPQAILPGLVDPLGAGRLGGGLFDGESFVLFCGVVSLVIGSPPPSESFPSPPPPAS
jgi:hypothetical protein